jgi:hypothetical protein
MAVPGLPQAHLQVPWPTFQDDGTLNVSRPAVTTCFREDVSRGRVVVVGWMDWAGPPHAVPRTATKHSADAVNVAKGFRLMVRPPRSPTLRNNSIGSGVSRMDSERPDRRWV